MVDFRADWCVPCRKFEKKVLADPEVKEALKGISFYTVDVTNAGDKLANNLVQEFKVKGVPTLLFYNTRGEEVERVTAFMKKSDFLGLVEQIKGEISQ